MANTKLNVYKMVLQEVCKKFSWAEEYLKNRIEELYDEKKKKNRRRGKLLVYELPQGSF